MPCGSVTELVGPAGVGKSQLCLMLAASALLDAGGAAHGQARPPSLALGPRRSRHCRGGARPGTSGTRRAASHAWPAKEIGADAAAPGASSRVPRAGAMLRAGCRVQVLYIDTERKFSARRLVDVAAARAGAGVFDGDALAARVLVVAPAGAPELLSLLQGLEAAVIERGVRLVVVDSIAALARAGFGAAQLPERQQALGAPRPPCGPPRPGSAHAPLPDRPATRVARAGTACALHPGLRPMLLERDAKP